MSLAAPMLISDQDIRSTTTVKSGLRFGQQAKSPDGRTFAFGQNGSASVTLAPGKLAQGAVSTANHINRTGATYAAGSTQVAFTLGATAVTAGQYNDGYLVVNAGTGVGQAVPVAGHTTLTSAGGVITVNLLDGLYVTTAVADSKFSLFPNIYSAALIASQAAATSVLPLGVPLVSIVASALGWFQTGGEASVLANGTPALGSGVIPSATTDGAVDVELAASVTARVGIMAVTAVSTEYRPVILTIAN
jgi:hypothetical protein